MDKLREAAKQVLKDLDGYNVVELSSKANLRKALAEQAEQEPVHWTQREIHPNERRAMEAQAYPFIFPPLSKAAPLAKQDTHATHVVQQVDLTDDEIAQAVGSPLDEVYLADFRAVIAADRKKNK